MEKHPATHRIKDINHPKLRQVRTGPIDIHHWEALQTNGNGQKTLFYDRGMSWEDLQTLYAESLEGDAVRDTIKYWPQSAKYRQVHTSITKDPGLPTFTHGTGWFADAVNSANSYYGSNRLLLHPGEYANNK